MVATTCDKNNANMAIAGLVLIQLEQKRMDITDKDALSSYITWSESLKQVVYRPLTLEEQEWLDEMIFADLDVLEALQTRLEQNVPMLNESSRWIGVQELLVHIMLRLFSDDTSSVVYDSRLRSALKSLAGSLLDVNSAKKSSAVILSLAENQLICRLSEQIKEVEEISTSKGRPGDESPKSPGQDLKKWAGIGVATIAGGLLVGVTGGLAVPFVASGLSALGVAGAGLTAFGSVAGAAIVGSVFGVTGAGLAGYKISKHFKDLEEFFFTPLSDVSPGLAYTITISGWLESIDDGPNQWHHLTELNPMLEVMLLNYDRQCLVDLTTAAQDYMQATAVSYGIYLPAVAATGAFAVAASLPITALSSVAMLDNPWNLCLSKSEQAGIELARNVIANFVGGKRPVTLVGHGFGARVIVCCLLELLKMKDSMDIFGLIDSVYIFGACISLSKAQWNEIKFLPASRFVNCYSSNDWFLKILFRIQLSPAAGSAPIEVDGIEDVDVSSLVSGHGDYVKKFEDLMAAVGIEKR